MMINNLKTSRLRQKPANGQLTNSLWIMCAGYSSLLFRQTPTPELTKNVTHSSYPPSRIGCADTLSYTSECVRFIFGA